MSRDGDEVFTSGRPGSDDQHVIQKYSRTGQLLNTWRVKCEHKRRRRLLQLDIGGTPYVAMSCRQCRSISLYSMTDSDPITAFIHRREDVANPFALCHGPDNTILASNLVTESREVLVYDVTSTQFTWKDRIPVHVDGALHIYYMETDQHGGIVIVSGILFCNIISAYSIASKTLVWKIENKHIDGKKFEPRGMCSHPDTGVLYVGDWKHERLIVIESNTGEVIHSIQVPGVVYDLAWSHVQPHLVVYLIGNKITYLNIK